MLTISYAFFEKTQIECSSFGIHILTVNVVDTKTSIFTCQFITWSGYFYLTFGTEQQWNRRPINIHRKLLASALLVGGNRNAVYLINKYPKISKKLHVHVHAYV